MEQKVMKIHSVWYDQEKKKRRQESTYRRLSKAGIE
jgi:hypothetical protein